MAKSSLDKKFDQIRKREEEKTFSTKKRSRIVNKFLNNWKPNFVLFVDSEIWPNLILNINKKLIKLINGVLKILL